MLVNVVRWPHQHGPVVAPILSFGEGVRELGGLWVIGTERHESSYRQTSFAGSNRECQGAPCGITIYLSLRRRFDETFCLQRLKGVRTPYCLTKPSNSYVDTSGRSSAKTCWRNNYDTVNKASIWWRQCVNTWDHLRTTLWCWLLQNDLAPRNYAMIRRNDWRSVDDMSVQIRWRNLKQSWTFAKYNLLPEDSISLDLEGLVARLIWWTIPTCWKSMMFAAKPWWRSRAKENLKSIDSTGKLITNGQTILMPLISWGNAVGSWLCPKQPSEYRWRFPCLMMAIGSIERWLRLMMKAQIHEQERLQPSIISAWQQLRKHCCSTDNLPADLDLQPQT